MRSPVGEIDIIARAPAALVFVEVKAREKFDDAAWRSPTDKGRIVAAAEFWLARHGRFDFRDMRFDAVLVVPGRMPQHIPAPSMPRG